MSYPLFREFKEILLREDLEQVLYLYLIEGLPYVFRKNPEGYQLFRKSISSKLDIPIRNVIIVGSGRVGFSLNPYHFGREFREDSDVDTVVVSHELFDRAWLELIRLESKWYEFTSREKEMIKEHIQHVYWGNIRPDKLPSTTGISRLWLETFAVLPKFDELVTREVKGYLFRTWWQVQLFYERCLVSLKSQV